MLWTEKTWTIIEDIQSYYFRGQKQVKGQKDRQNKNKSFSAFVFVFAQKNQNATLHHIIFKSQQIFETIKLYEGFME